jgi:uncharacterized membrane protein YgcG
MSIQSFRKGTAIALITIMGIGCKSNEGLFGVDNCATVPAGAIPVAPGTNVCQWQHAQVAAASTDLGVFYQADFVGTTDKLGPAANEHVARMVQQGLVGKTTVIIELSDEPERDSARAIALATAFTDAGIPMTADQIQLAYPAAQGLDSLQAQQVARTAGRLGNQRGGGGGGGGMGGGMGGGGMGGGGMGGGFGGGGMF